MRYLCSRCASTCMICPAPSAHAWAQAHAPAHVRVVWPFNWSRGCIFGQLLSVISLSVCTYSLVEHCLTRRPQYRRKWLSGNTSPVFTMVIKEMHNGQKGSIHLNHIIIWYILMACSWQAGSVHWFCNTWIISLLFLVQFFAVGAFRSKRWERSTNDAVLLSFAPLAPFAGADHSRTRKAQKSISIEIEIATKQRPFAVRQYGNSDATLGLLVPWNTPRWFCPQPIRGGETHQLCSSSFHWCCSFFVIPLYSCCRHSIVIMTCRRHAVVVFVLSSWCSRGCCIIIIPALSCDSCHIVIQSSSRYFLQSSHSCLHSSFVIWFWSRQLTPSSYTLSSYCHHAVVALLSFIISESSMSHRHTVIMYSLSYHCHDAVVLVSTIIIPASSSNCSHTVIIKLLS